MRSALGLELDRDLHLVHREGRIRANVLDLQDVGIRIGQISEQPRQRAGAVRDPNPELQVAPRSSQTVADDPQQQHRVDVAPRQDRDDRAFKGPLAGIEQSRNSRCARWLDDHLGALEQKQHSAREHVLADGLDRVDQLTDDRIGDLPRTADRDAVSHRGHAGERHGPTGCQGRRVGRGLLRLHPDDAHVGSPGLDCCRNAGAQSAAADIDEDGLDLGALLKDLQAAGPRPGDDVDVVERMDQDSTGLSLKLLCPHEAFVDAGPELFDVGTIRTSGHQLGYRGSQRHEYGRLDTEHLSRECHTLSVVSGAGRHHTAGLLLIAEARHARVRAADLERSSTLEVLALEVDVTPHSVGQRLAELQGGGPDDGAEQLLCSEHVVKGHGQRR